MIQISPLKRLLNVIGAIPTQSVRLTKLRQSNGVIRDLSQANKGIEQQCLEEKNFHELVRACS